MNEPARVSRLFQRLRSQHRSAFYSPAKRRRLAVWILPAMAITDGGFKMPRVTNPYIVDIALLCAVFLGILIGSMLPESLAVVAVLCCAFLVVVFVRRLRQRGRFRDREE